MKMIRKGALRELFLKLDHVERYVMENRYEYIKGSSVFSSSIPPELNNKEGVIRYFEGEIAKMRMVASKLEERLKDYKIYDLRMSQFELHNRPDFINLSLEELRLTFFPINSVKNKPYTVDGIRYMINSTSMVEKMEKNNSYLYSPVDFENYLIQSRRNYNKEVSDRILEYIHSVKTGIDSTVFHTRLKEIRKNIDPNGHQPDSDKDEGTS
jgi:hypothetical protein